MADHDDELDLLRSGCTRFLSGHGPQDAARLLGTIPPDTELDRYGDGGVVAALEDEIAGLLGKPAAVFLPSGTMAQQSVLRVHADRRASRTIGFHPACHVDRHEGRGYERLHNLTGRPIGDPNRLLTGTDLEAVAEPLAVLLLELPQRDLGGQQPAWEDLQAQLAWAREHGSAVHMDGARLWESAAGYGRAPADVAALFDTVYVSFYKAVGALPGCCVAGPAEVITEVREWRRRMGGTLFGLWPNAASARTCLAERLPRMQAYLDHAIAIAAALAGLDGVQVVPDPPQVPMMHVLLRTSQEAFAAAARRLAAERGVWVARPQPSVTGDPSTLRLELSVGDATCALEPAEIREIFADLVGATQADIA
ncbi:MAG TPA: beta-eliminating lyase-related protein [Streptosporangiaceae bacterium]|jgi:threonine aldolase